MTIYCFCTIAINHACIEDTVNFWSGERSENDGNIVVMVEDERKPDCYFYNYSCNCTALYFSGSSEFLPSAVSPSSACYPTYLFLVSSYILYVLLRTWTLFSWVSRVTDHDVIVIVNDPYNEVIAYNGKTPISMHSMVMACMV